MPALLGVVAPVIAVFAALLVGRAAAGSWPGPVCPSGGKRAHPTPLATCHGLGRTAGSLSMVLVIGLPVDRAPREPLLLVVFGVVSVSLFLQGPTMGPPLGALGLRGTATRQDAYEVARARAVMASHALAEVESRADAGILTPAPPSVWQRCTDSERSRKGPRRKAGWRRSRVRATARCRALLVGSGGGNATARSRPGNDRPGCGPRPVHRHRGATRSSSARRRRPGCLRHAVDTVVPDVRSATADAPVSADAPSSVTSRCPCWNRCQTR